jgi:hypothetical protein
MAEAVTGDIFLTSSSAPHGKIAALRSTAL